MNKKIIGIILMFILLLTGCGNNAVYETDKGDNNKMAKIEVKDDSGRVIKMEKPAERIISLYSAHTENLFALGLDKEIIGRGKSDAYPPAVIKKPIYSYKEDPEKILAVQPDLVLIRPFIERSTPQFVKTLEEAGITVASFYPDKFDEFDDYIKRLAALTGKEERAKELLEEFHNELEKAKKSSDKITNKVKVFFESTDTNIRTVTPYSTAAQTIKMAGGINAAKDALVDPNKSTSIADYGAERVIEKANEIDVYIAQRGAMNSGGNIHTITIRPGFDKIKAIKNDRVYNINEKLISSPVFRHVKGVSELQRMFYPEIFDDISIFNSEEEVTREKFAKIAVMAKHKPIFAPTSKSYKSKKTHVYGDFIDVDINDQYFDYIETAVLSAYLSYEGNKFNPKANVTREELAKALYLFKDLEMKEVEISDIEQCDNVNIVKYVVGNEILELEQGKFNPKRNVTEKEVVEAIGRLKLH